MGYAGCAAVRQAGGERVSPVPLGWYLSPRAVYESLDLFEKTRKVDKQKLNPKEQIYLSKSPKLRPD